MPEEVPTLLMVDDNPADVELARLMIEELNAPLEFKSCSTGEDALAYLHQTKSSPEARNHRYMFLDLKMPGMDGFDILRTIRGDPSFDGLHVVVLTNSAFQTNVEEAYRLGANSVVTKPSSVDDYQAILADLHETWQNLNRA